MHASNECKSKWQRPGETLAVKRVDFQTWEREDITYILEIRYCKKTLQGSKGSAAGIKGNKPKGKLWSKNKYIKK